VDEELIRVDQIQPVLPRYAPSAYHVYAVSPQTRFATPKARAFVEFLRTHLAA